MHRCPKGWLMIILMLGVTLLTAQTVSFRIKPDKLEAGARGILSATLTIPADMKQSHDPTVENDFFYLLASHPSLSFGRLNYPTPTKIKAENEWEYHGSVTLTLPFTVNQNAPAGKIEITAEMGFNPCYETGLCRPPDERTGKVTLEILASPKVVETPDTRVEVADGNAEQNSEIAKNDDAAVEDAKVLPAGVADADVPPPDAPAGNPLTRFLLFALIAFAGGIILNAMPCVLPVLSIRAMSIVRQAQEDKRRILSNSMAYTGGILIAFSILAAVVVILKLAGESVGWGFQFQNIWFNVFLISIIYVFALSLFDVFIINAPGMSGVSKVSSKGGIWGSFGGGLIAVPLATACSAPLLGPAIGFAFMQPVWVIPIFFLLIGLGLAFPITLLGFIPSVLRIIPKPGEWMNIFKEIMGFVLIGFALWMLHDLYQMTDGDYMFRVLLFLGMLSFAAWLFGRFVRPEYKLFTQWNVTLWVLAIIVASSMYFLPYEAKTVQPVTVSEDGLMIPAPKAPAGWYQFSPEVMNTLIGRGEPVFLDFGAVWCKNCKLNEARVLFRPDTMEEFKAKGVHLIKGDFTHGDPEIQKWMAKHNRAGVPFSILYIPGKEPVLFSEIITRKAVQEALALLPDKE